MFKNFPRDWRWYTPLLWIPTVAAAIWLIGSIPWPKSFEAWSEGTSTRNSPAQVFSYLVGPLGALAAFGALYINVVSTRQTLERATNADRADRFQKGAELLGEDQQTAQQAGVLLLQQLALEQPDTYGDPVIRIFKRYVTDTAPNRAQLRQFFRPDGKAFDPVWVEGRIAAADASVAIAKIANRVWPVADDMINDDGLMSIWGADMCDIYMSGEDFRHVALTNAVLRRVTFRKSNLEGSKVAAIVSDFFVVRECNLKGCHFWLYTNDRVLIDPSVAPSRILRIVDPISIDGFRVNGKPFDQTWVQHAARDA